MRQGSLQNSNYTVEDRRVSVVRRLRSQLCVSCVSGVEPDRANRVVLAAMLVLSLFACQLRCQLCASCVPVVCQLLYRRRGADIVCLSTDIYIQEKNMTCIAHHT